MPIAVDFSDDHPPITTLKAHDVVAVGRYLTGRDGKAITKPELDLYVASGIVVWFVFEDTASDASGGTAAGETNAHAVLDALTALGLPWSQPVYFAVDSNVAITSTAPYFEGIHSVYSLDDLAVGAYGDGAILDFLGAQGLAHWFWQSNSTSYPGNLTTIPAAHIRQVPPADGTSPIPGTDLDQLLQGDVGQYPRPAQTNKEI